MFGRLARSQLGDFRPRRVGHRVGMSFPSTSAHLGFIFVKSESWKPASCGFFLTNRCRPFGNLSASFDTGSFSRQLCKWHCIMRDVTYCYGDKDILK